MNNPSTNQPIVPRPTRVPPGPDPASPAAAWGAAAPPASEGGESMWALVRDRLEGRWLPAIIVGLVVGAAFAVVGWRSAAPMYESVGVIRVTPRVPVVMGKTAEWELSNFGMFVQTQVQLIRSRRVLEHAMTDHKLLATEFAEQADVQERLDEGLSVDSGRNSELIYVKFEDESPVVAQAVVNAVIGSYDEIYGQAGGNQVGQILEQLRDVEARSRREYNRVRADIAAITGRYGLDPAELQALKRERLEAARKQVAAAERALSGTDQAPGAGGDETIGPIVFELEKIYPDLALSRQSRDGARLEFGRVRQRYRADSVAWSRAERELAYREAEFREQYALALDYWERLPNRALPGGEVGRIYEGWPRAQLEREITLLEDESTALREEIQALVGDINLLGDKRDEEESIKANLARAEARIQELKTEEKNIAGRISVEQEGYRPLAPGSDGRRRRAAAGLGAGLALSFGLFFIWGTLDRRAFGAAQLQPAGAAAPLPLLGVVPALGDGLDDETSDVASHCVHLIRNQIESIRDPHHGYVMSVSSPFQGDGKTSLVLSLGRSYAISGHRVLLVDCDLVGRSLTRQLGLGRHAGLRDAIAEGDASDAISALGLDRLDVMPAGLSDAVGPETLRRDDLAALLAPLREVYDIIMVDTGPLLGSLESAPVIAAVDGMALVVRRGRSRARLEECLGRLTAVGTHCLGVILNCATRADCIRSVSEASLVAVETDGVNPARRRVFGRDAAGPENGRNPLLVAMERNQGPHDAEAA